MAKPWKSRNAPLGGLLSVVMLAWACANAPELASREGGSETGAGYDAEPAADGAAADESTSDATRSDEGPDDAGSVGVDANSPGDAASDVADEDALGGDARLGADASDDGDNADSESANATNDGGVTPDVASPTEAGGDSGGDPLVLSTTSIQIDGQCAESQPMESLPQTGVAPSFSVTNAGGVPVAWTATVTGAAFVLDTTGSTLAPGASTSVHITPLAIRAVPSSPLIGSATVAIHAQLDAGFDQTVEVDEYVDACVISGATPLDFGDVPLGGSSTIGGVAPHAACHDHQGTGIAFAQHLELGSTPGFDSTFTATYLGEAVWEVTFQPIDSVGNPVVGTQSAYLPIGINSSEGGGPICDPLYVNGLFVQGTGVQ